MKKRLVIIIMVILLLGILFPFAALSQLSTDYATIFNSIFNSLISHILMHMALFGALAWIVMSFASQKKMPQIILMSLGSVLLVGMIQEIIQMVSVGVFNIGASLFDLGIDLAGGSIPLFILFISRKISVKQQ
jgi:hypothetical protein